jgi:hypothetical protein
VKGNESPSTESHFSKSFPRLPLQHPIPSLSLAPPYHVVFGGSNFAPTSVPSQILLSGCDGSNYIKTTRDHETAPRNSVIPSYISPLPKSLAAEDIEYLHAKGALTTPTAALRNQLIKSFVEYVYPFLPLINLEEFLRVVQDDNGKGGQISLLVFQAVMHAGSGVVDMRYLQAAGYESRTTARQALFRKIKVCARVTLTDTALRITIASVRVRR